jgi:hypothetical protein
MKLTIGQIIGLAAAALVLLCFFFPWVELNLLLASTNLTGFQLATGSGPAGAKFGGVPSLLLVPLSMLLALVIGLVAGLGNGSQAGTKVSKFLLITGLVSAAIILYQYLTLNQELNQNVLGMITQKVFSYTFGAHGALFGSVVVAGSGLMDMFGTKKATTAS